MERIQERLAKLDLTADQKKQVESLKDEIAESIRGITPQLKDASPEERRKLIRDAVGGDVREKFLSILTPEQRQQLQADAGDKRLPGRKPLADLRTPKGEKKDQASDTPLIARLRRVVDDLGLTDEQKPKVDKIFDDAQQQARQIRQDAAGDREAARDKAVDLAKSLRDRLKAVLTPEQQKQLMDNLPRGPGGRRLRDGADKDAGPATRPAAVPLNDTTHTPDPAAAKAASASSRPADPTIGGPAPAFSLVRLNASTVTNKTLLGKPAVLAFGSLTDPAFRDRLPKLAALQYRYHGRATVLAVYTREAHPSDGPWPVERNKDENIDVPRPTTMAARVALAKQLHDRTKADLDVVVDDLDDTTLKAFGDKPTGAVVLGPTGTVVGTQNFCDPSGLPRLIDAAMKR